MLNKDIAGPLRKAEANIAIAFSRLSKLGPGNIKGWPGSWAEYQKLGKLLSKVRNLAIEIENKQKRIRE